MKALMIIICASVILSPLHSHADVEIGDSLKQVFVELGSPDGYLKTESRTVLYYERGKVELVDGEVVQAELISEKEATRRRIEREQAEALRARLEAQRRSRLIVEGQEAKNVLLTDPDFLSSPASVQVSVWREFAERYPDVPLPDHYLDALKRHEAQLAREAQERRIDELEARVAEAERKAAEADFDDSRFTYGTYYVVPRVYDRGHHRRHSRRRSGVHLKYVDDHFAADLGYQQLARDIRSRYAPVEKRRHHYRENGIRVSSPSASLYFSF